MPQIIMMPPTVLPVLSPASSAVSASSSTGRKAGLALLARKDPADLHSCITWFKLREPLLVDTIEECLIVLSQEKDTLSTLDRISEARIA